MNEAMGIGNLPEQKGRELTGRRVALLNIVRDMDDPEVDKIVSELTDIERKEGDSARQSLVNYIVSRENESQITPIENRLLKKER